MRRLHLCLIGRHGALLQSAFGVQVKRQLVLGHQSSSLHQAIWPWKPLLLHHLQQGPLGMLAWLARDLGVQLLCDNIAGAIVQQRVWKVLLTLHIHKCPSASVTEVALWILRRDIQWPTEEGCKHREVATALGLHMGVEVPPLQVGIHLWEVVLLDVNVTLNLAHVAWRRFEGHRHRGLFHHTWDIRHGLGRQPHLV